MILFRDDWDKYPYAIPDFTTKNESFLRLSALYKEMGVKNNTFILALHNKDLIGVDPFDPNLSFEVMGAINEECEENPWYYFREISRAPALAGVGSRPFKANRGNIALYWSFFNHIMIILLQPRQTGKSFSTDSLMTYLTNIGTANTQINLLTRSDGLRAENLVRLKKIQELLPDCVNKKRKSDVFNTEELNIGLLGNKYIGHLSSSSVKAAHSVGRGFTSPIAHGDEVVYVNNIEIALPAALMAGNAAREEARLIGAPYGLILTTTAGKKDDRDGAYIYKILNDASVWSEFFFDTKNPSELRNMVLSGVRAEPGKPKRPFINATFSYKQLGYDDAWMRRVLEESIAEGFDADRDLFNIWTSGSESSPLPQDITQAIRSSVRDDFYLEISKGWNYVVRWHIPEREINQRMASSKYVMGLDTSDASGNDDIGMVILDIETGEVVAAGNYNETSLPTFSAWIAHFLIRFPNILFFPERKSSAITMIDHLLIELPRHGIDPFRRIFNMAVQKADEFKERFEAIARTTYHSEDEYTSHKKLFGFTTSGYGLTSRNELYGNVFKNAAKYTCKTVHDKVLVDQILSLVIKGGRIDHGPGNHDDMVIAWLLSFWSITNGKNLAHYGIESSKLLSRCNNRLDEIETGDDYRVFEQQRLQAEMEDLLDSLKIERDQNISYGITLRLRKVVKELESGGGNPLSIEQLLENIKTFKKAYRRGG